MREIISEELRYLFICIFNGFMLTMVYDAFRILRRIIKHRKWILYLEDILYGLCIGFYLFKVNFDKNNGVVRGFVFIALLCGSLIYSKLFSNSVVHVISTFFNKIKKKIQELLRIVEKNPINNTVRRKKISKFR